MITEVHDVQLELGKRADYAIRVILDLARHTEQRKSREIAQEMDIPRSYLPRILAMLVDAGLVVSRAGPAGGYRLAGSPATISLLTVVEAAEGPLRSTECVLRGGACRWNGTCVVHAPWTEAQEALRERLAATSFADLAALGTTAEVSA
ncbi:MAG: Rrf2 family transcriptional regulator [Nitriliruptorales bacterium]|nr:Rrf2 family transcriptional regulator [Nitriliruptorales bacterium]